MITIIIIISIIIPASSCFRYVWLDRNKKINDPSQGMLIIILVSSCFRYIWLDRSKKIDDPSQGMLLYPLQSSS